MDDGKGQVNGHGTRSAAHRVRSTRQRPMHPGAAGGARTRDLGARGSRDRWRDDDVAGGRESHRDGILHTTVVPAAIDERLAEQARSIAHQIVAALDWVGVMGVECFIADGGRVLVNELAPPSAQQRTLDLDACVTSQFEQQVRALSGPPLGSTMLLTHRDGQHPRRPVDRSSAAVGNVRSPFPACACICTARRNRDPAARWATTAVASTPDAALQTVLEAGEARG